MPVDARIVVAVLQQHLFEVLGGLGEVFDVECYILYYHRGAEFSGSTHRGEDARANCPILGVFGWIVGEIGGHI